MSMKKVAVFGNAGGGKSTLSRRLAEITGLPLYVLDIIQFRGGIYRPDEKDGGKFPDEEYLSIHREILSRDEWIIDGYGSLPTVWERISVADTLVYIDLPIMTHYWGGSRSPSLRVCSKIPRAGRRTAQCGRVRWMATG
jgi:adenylate kinase family enzyme